MSDTENMKISDAAVEAAAGAFLLESIKRKGELGASSLALLAALEAAAPHMSRTIATVPELDALPAGSVVMGFDVDGDQLVSRKASNGLWEQAGTDDGWQAVGIIEWHGRVTVLHEP